MKLKCPICDSHGALIYSAPDVTLARYGFLKAIEDVKSEYKDNMKLSILFCGDCNFAWNSEFSYDKINYGSEQIIEAGHFSQRYLKYQKKSAAFLTKLIGGQPKRVVEIGAGEGIFLKELKADSKIAIEPSHEAKKINDPSIEIYNKYFKSEEFKIPADLVVMRQVLEHIDEPVNFLKGIISSFEGYEEFNIYIEIPSSHLTFKAGRFYDYYYEHCNYFTHQSLISLANRIDMQITFMSSGMDGEISSILMTKKCNKPSCVKEVLENSIEKVSKKIQLYINEGKKFLFWGASGNGVQILNQLKISNEIMPYVVDSDVNKQGLFFPGTYQKIISPHDAVSYNPEVVIISSQFHKDEIKEACCSYFGEIDIVVID